MKLVERWDLDDPFFEIADIGKHLLGQHDQSTHGHGDKPEPIKTLDSVPFSSKHFTKIDEPYLLSTVKSYTADNGCYTYLNNAHRGPLNRNQIVANVNDPDVQELTKTMDLAISKAPTLTKPIQVFRGIPEKVGDTMRVGDVYKDKGYLSTSISQKIATGFGGYGERKTTFRISVPKGKKAFCPSVFGAAKKSEGELIFGRNAEMKITAITTNQYVGMIIDAEML